MWLIILLSAVSAPTFGIPKIGEKAETIAGSQSKKDELENEIDNMHRRVQEQKETISRLERDAETAEANSALLRKVKPHVLG